MTDLNQHIATTNGIDLFRQYEMKDAPGKQSQLAYARTILSKPSAH